MTFEQRGGRFEVDTQTQTLTSPVMGDAEFVRACEELGTTHAAIANTFGADERTSRRWANGSAAIPPLVAVLMRLLLSVRAKKSYASVAQQLRAEADMLDQLEQAKRNRLR